MAPAKRTARHTYWNTGGGKLRLWRLVGISQAAPIVTTYRAHAKSEEWQLFAGLRIGHGPAAFAVAVVVGADAVLLPQAGHQLRQAFAIGCGEKGAVVEAFA